MNREYQIINEDARTALQRFRGRADLIVTSPPYADARKRHYDSIDPDDYAAWFASFHEPLAAALKPEGSLVINIKDKIVDGVRHRYVWDTIKALEGLGWYAIDDYLWHKPNAMPGYLADPAARCLGVLLPPVAHASGPYIDFDAVKRPIGEWANSRLARLGANDTTRQNSANASGFGRNISRWADRKTVLPDNVLSLPLVGKNKGHPAVFPVELPAFFIRLLTPKDGLVIDPFGGSGTTAIAAFQEGRSCVLIDNNQEILPAGRRASALGVRSHRPGAAATARAGEGSESQQSWPSDRELRHSSARCLTIFSRANVSLVGRKRHFPRSRRDQSSAPIRCGQGRPQAAPQGSP